MLRVGRRLLFTLAVGAMLAAAAHAKPGSTDERSDSGFGGGPFWPLRYVPAVADLNGYFKDLGSYPAMSEFFIPLLHGGGGTLRYSVNGNLQFGMEWAGFGQEVGGFAKHGTGLRGTVDADGDGYDDYRSYAGYRQFYGAGIAQYKWALAPSFFLQTGIKTGLGSEKVHYGMYRREGFTDVIGITSGANSWTRTSLLGSVYAGLQVALDGDRNVIKLGLEAGVDGHHPLTEWQAGTGVHKDMPTPPATMRAHNFWVTIGPQFHY